MTREKRKLRREQIRRAVAKTGEPEAVAKRFGVSLRMVYKAMGETR